VPEGGEGKVCVVKDADVETVRADQVHGGAVEIEHLPDVSDLAYVLPKRMASMRVVDIERVSLTRVRSPFRAFGAQGYIELGRIGFSRKAIEKIGFDPIELLSTQDKRIEDMQAKHRKLLGNIDELTKTITLNETDKKKLESEIEEARKPLYKKVLSFIGVRD
jgi:hypothetical protein